MAIMEAGRTEHIVVNYDDSRGPDAGSRAQMLLGSCEADLMRLERDYFRIAGIFEPPSPPLLVVVSSGSFASNNGYDPHRQSTITIETFPVALDQDLADETVRMLFVAEAAEVLMEFLNVLAQRWHSRLSDGEGLSRVLAAEFYPDAYYGAMIHGPFGNAWLTDASRSDPTQAGRWISRNDSSDTRADSFGCAALFIYYLRSQLGYPWDHICSWAGPTLADTYTALTGRGDGQDAFTRLMDAHFPPGSTTPIKSENPFPLWDAQDRSVDIGFGQRRFGLSSQGAEGVAETSAFIGCPPAKYRYTIFNDTVDLRCTAETYGFGQPQFSWKVNGEPVTGSSGTLIAPGADIGVDIPDKPGQQTHHAHDEALAYWVDDASTYERPAGELILRNTRWPGSINVAVEVRVTEANDPAVTTEARVGTLDTRRIVYDAEFYLDRERCRTALHEMARRYVKDKRLLNLLLTLPDPPPDLVRAARQLDRVWDDVHSIARENEEAGAQIASAVAELGLAPAAERDRGSPYLR